MGLKPRPHPLHDILPIRIWDEANYWILDTVDVGRGNRTEIEFADAVFLGEMVHATHNLALGVWGWRRR